MRFSYSLNSEEVEAAIDSFAFSLESGEQARVVADDFRDLLAPRPPAKRARRSTNMLGPRQLGAVNKASD